MSGGETGADRAGLEAGVELGIATGGKEHDRCECSVITALNNIVLLGFAMKGFKTEDGNDPSLADFGIEEEFNIHSFSDLSSLVRTS